MKTALAAIFILILIATGLQAQTVLNQPSVGMAWDTITIAGLPPTASVSYDVGTKLSPQTVPTLVGNVATPAAVFTFTGTYGTYAMCARGIVKNSGTVVSTGAWGCSDVSANVQGGVTFVNSFWPSVPDVSNLRKTTP